MLAASVVAMLLTAPAAARAAVPGGALRTASSSQLVPVWAFISGGVPVAGGRVMIVTGGKRLRLLNGAVSKPTDAKGVAVLEVRRIPRRFAVVVEGGRAGGRRLTGSLRSIPAADPDASVVEVDPLTTLVTELRARRPGLGLADAARAIKRYFGVPGWADLGQDVRTSPRWFDANAYLRDAIQYGSIDRLNRALADQILGGLRPMRPPAFTAAAARPRAGAAAGLAVLTAGQLVGQLFKYLGTAVLRAGSQRLLGGALGGLLELAKSAGLDLTGKSELDGVREQLSALGTQLTQLEGKLDAVSKIIAQSHASQLLHQSDEIIGRIDHARAQLALLANLNPTDPTQKKFAETISAYIATNLLDAPARLNRQLNPALGIADNAIKAASRALAASVRFFDARQSDEVRAVYDYFAVYQAQLAVLLTNYWNANPDTYSLDTRTASLAQLDANVTKSQVESLKPTVPAGTFIDTRTPTFMWAPEDRTVDALTLQRSYRTSKTIAVGNFHNYQVPTFADLRKLVEGATGDKLAWLQAQIKVKLSSQPVWAWDSLRKVRKPLGAPGYEVSVSAFSLTAGAEERLKRTHKYGRVGPAIEQWSRGKDGCGLENPNMQHFLRELRAKLLLLRHLAPGESYWWGSPGSQGSPARAPALAQAAIDFRTCDAQMNVHLP